MYTGPIMEDTDLSQHFEHHGPFCSVCGDPIGQWYRPATECRDCADVIESEFWEDDCDV